MEVGIVSSHLIWLLRTRSIRRKAREVGQTYDEYVDPNRRPSCTPSYSSSTQEKEDDYDEAKEKEEVDLSDHA
jgi:hypothetical protein